MKQTGESEYTLSTGKVFYANRGIIGHGPDEYDEFTEGFDGHCDEGIDEPFTPAEKIEICEYMIERWTALKAKIGGAS